MAETTTAPGNSTKRRSWVSLVPYGLNEQHPNAYLEMLGTAWENRDNPRYAWRILRDGCCDGCALGTTGMRDWTMTGVHLCAVRLGLLRLNTMPAMDWRRLEDVSKLESLPGRARIARIKPGSVQGHWPEVNVLIGAGCLDASGVPDYNAIVEIAPERAAKATATDGRAAAAVEARVDN